MTAVDIATLPGVRWAALLAAERRQVEALGHACHASDGGFMPLPLAGHLDAGSPAIGAWSDNGDVLGVSAVRLQEGADETVAAVMGQVHPSARGRGIGRHLIEWSIAQGQALLAGAEHPRPRALRIATEGLTPDAEHLYARYGFAQNFAEDVMRRDLAGDLPDAPLPPGIALDTWVPQRAEQFFAAYDGSFRTRPGFPGWSAEQWIEWATDDEDFRPELSLLARACDTPVGFLIGAEGWVVQVGVVPAWRGRGLGAALVAEILRRAQAAGARSTLLTVNVNNPGAARVYERLGFVRIGRRARFLRPA